MYKSWPAAMSATLPLGSWREPQSEQRGRSFMAKRQSSPTAAEMDAQHDHGHHQQEDHGPEATPWWEGHHVTSLSEVPMIWWFSTSATVVA
jgi:hypothetical protein